MDKKFIWFKQPDQPLATGGKLEQWLRSDDYTGSVTKVSGKEYHAQWVDYRGCRTPREAQMREAHYPTLIAAQARVVAEVDQSPPRFRTARTDQ